MGTLAFHLAIRIETPTMVTRSSWSTCPKNETSARIARRLGVLVSTLLTFAACSGPQGSGPPSAGSAGAGQGESVSTTKSAAASDYDKRCDEDLTAARNAFIALE